MNPLGVQYIPLEFHQPYGTADYRQADTGGRRNSTDPLDRDAREERQGCGQRGRHNNYDRRHYSPPRNLERWVLKLLINFLTKFT